MITPITAFSLTSRDGCLQMEKERSPCWLQAVFFPLGWAGGKVAKSKPGGEKVVETCWQGLGCDGETPSLRFPVLSRTPPIIAGLTGRSRAGACGWAMGAVSFLPSPSPADWFPWQEPPPPAPRGRKREWWEGYKVSVSSNFGLKWKNRSINKKIWGDIHKVNKQTEYGLGY